SILSLANGWTASAQPIGITPQNIAPTDTGLTNLTFTYTGPIIAGPMTFTGFSAQSIYNQNTTGVYSTQATNNDGGPQTGTTDRNIGNVAVPMSATPEPALLLVLLPVFGFVVYRARTRFA